MTPDSSLDRLASFAWTASGRPADSAVVLVDHAREESADVLAAFGIPRIPIAFGWSFALVPRSAAHEVLRAVDSSLASMFSARIAPGTFLVLSFGERWRGMLLSEDAA